MPNPNPKPQPDDRDRRDDADREDERDEAARSRREAETVIAQELEMPEEARQLLEELKAELDTAVEARKRALADFHNYQRRAAENETRALEEGAAMVVRSLLGVLDHFDLALNQDPQKINVEQLLGGVRMVRDELITALESRGVERIEPDVGSEFDPNLHEAVFREPTGEVEPNHITGVISPGYRMTRRILRPARVRVAAPPEGQGGGDE